MESEKRRYSLTRDPSYLEPYGISDESVRGEIQSLQTLVADDPLQSLRAAHLALIVASKLRPMNELLATANTSGMEAALTLLRGMDEIQSQIDQMLDVEGFQLTRWQVRLDALQQGTIWFVAAAVGIAIIFAGAAFSLARIEVRRRRKATEENIRLYGDLERREAKIRRLVDSNIVGIMIPDLGGRIVEANDAFLDMVGYSRDDLASGRLRWTDMTPAEWLPVSEQAMLRMRTTGRCEPFEKEYIRKDGSRVPVLVGAAAFERGRDEAVAFVLDLTERKQAEGRQRLLLDERKRAEYLTGQVFESSPDGVCIVGRDYRYQRVNPSHERNWGVPTEKIVGMHVADVVGINVFEQTIKPQLDQCFAGQEVSYAEWFTNSCGRRYMAITYSPMRPDADQVEAALVITATSLSMARLGALRGRGGTRHVNRVCGAADGLDITRCPAGPRRHNADAALRWLAPSSRICRRPRRPSLVSPGTACAPARSLAGSGPSSRRYRRARIGWTSTKPSSKSSP